MVYFTFGKDSNTSTGSNPPGPNRLCLSISSSFFASSICSLSFSIARFLILVLNASNSSSKALRYSWSAIAILKGGTNKNFCNFHICTYYKKLQLTWRKMKRYTIEDPHPIVLPIPKDIGHKYTGGQLVPWQSIFPPILNSSNG